MYKENLNMKVFGVKITLVHVLILVVLGLMASHLVAGCCRMGLMEGMEVIGAELQALPEYAKKDGEASKDPLAYREQDHDSYQSKFVAPEDNLNYFAQTEFKPECCGSNYSANGGLLKEGGFSSGGCACMNREQIQYINQRGGNRTGATEF